jgi:DNA-binding NtrC family response regulator
LRERRDDIEPLATLFLQIAAEVNNMRAPKLTSEVTELLQAYSWPGNVRELRNTMERAVVIAMGDVLTPQDLPNRVRIADIASSSPISTPFSEGPGRDDGHAVPQGEGLRSWLEQVEREAIVSVLKEVGGRPADAARRLQMPLRTLQHRMKSLGVKRRGYVDE